MEHFTTRQLRAGGLSEKQIRSAVARGALIRLRIGHFARPDASAAAMSAVRAGGSLACVSELRHRGVWVLDSPQLHIRVARNAARLPDQAVRRHWDTRPPADDGHVDVVSALIQAHGCLERRAWIASVDSALHIGALQPSQLPELRSGLPQLGRRALDLTDRRAESGLESIVRVIALDLGLRVRSQVRVAGVGRVDLIVEGWVVIETDGSAFHDQPLSARDRARDARLVAGGRAALRPGYSLIVYNQPAVARQLIGAVATHRRVAGSGRIVARARRRAAILGLS